MGLGSEKEKDDEKILILGMFPDSNSIWPCEEIESFIIGDSKAFGLAGKFKDRRFIFCLLNLRDYFEVSMKNGKKIRVENKGGEVVQELI